MTPAGRGGRRVIGGEVWRVDIGGNLLENVSDDLVTGSVDWAYDRNGGLFGSDQGTALAATFTLRHTARVDPLTDYLRPFLLLGYSDGRAAEQIPLGVFALDQPAERHTATVGEPTYTGQDLTAVLRNAFFTSAYTATSGTEFDADIREIIEGAGIPSTMHNIRESTKTLGYPRVFTETWSRLAAVNKLAHAAGWYRLFADLDGRLTTLPYRSMATSQPAAIYTAADPVNDLTIEPRSHVANEVRLRARRQGRSTLTSIATNDDPDDPTSTIRRGRTILANGGWIDVDDIDTQDDLDAEAARMLEEAREQEQVVRLQVLPARPPGMLRTIDLAFGGAKAHLDGRYSCRAWQVGFTPADALMQLDLRRVVTPTDVMEAAS